MRIVRTNALLSEENLVRGAVAYTPFEVPCEKLDLKNGAKTKTLVHESGQFSTNLIILQELPARAREVVGLHPYFGSNTNRITTGRDVDLVFQTRR